MTAPIHKQCIEMHKAKYCVCCMVSCVHCDHVHPPSKPHRDELTPNEEKVESKP
jgi:hypothetical protein